MVREHWPNGSPELDTIVLYLETLAVCLCTKLTHLRSVVDAVCRDRHVELLVRVAPQGTIKLLQTTCTK